MGVPEEGTSMFPNRAVEPSISTTRLPDPVPVHDYDACPVATLMRRLGERWVLVVLAVLAERAHRFNELDRRIDGISRRMLTRTLRTLQHDGLVRRTELPGATTGVEYDLTPRGTDLLRPLSDLADWASAECSYEQLAR